MAKSIILTFLILLSFTVVISCGSDLPERGEGEVGGSQSLEKDDYFSSDELDLLEKMCAALKVKSQTFNALFVGKSRVLVYSLDRKNCLGNTSIDNAEIRANVTAIPRRDPGDSSSDLELDPIDRSEGVFKYILEAHSRDLRTICNINTDGPDRNKQVRWRANPLDDETTDKTAKHYYLYKGGSAECLEGISSSQNLCLNVANSMPTSEEGDYKVFSHEKFMIQIRKSTYEGIVMKRSLISNSLCDGNAVETTIQKFDRVIQ